MQRRQLRLPVLCQSLEGTTTRFLKQSLETDLAQKTQEKTDEAAAGLNAQIELLQLLKGSPSPDTPPYVEAALNKTFLRNDIAELRQQYELERDALIPPLSLPSTPRQTRSQGRFAKRSAVETTQDDVAKTLLDTPVFKKPHRKNTQKLALPKPLHHRRSSRLFGPDLSSLDLPLPVMGTRLSASVTIRKSTVPLRLGHSLSLSRPFTHISWSTRRLHTTLLKMYASSQTASIGQKGEIR